MKKVVQLLIEQMNASREFTKRNFGLEVGSDYPEIVKECIGDEGVAVTLFTESLKLLMSSNKEIQESLDGRFAEKGPSALVTNSPMFYSLSMKFFYWGIQVGRELEKSQSSMLNAMKEG